MALPPEDPGSQFGMGNRNRPLLLGAIVVLVLLAIMFGMRHTTVGPESTVNETTTTAPTTTTPPATTPPATTPRQLTPPATTPPTTTPPATNP